MAKKKNPPNGNGDGGQQPATVAVATHTITTTGRSDSKQTADCWFRNSLTNQDPPLVSKKDKFGTGNSSCLFATRKIKKGGLVALEQPLSLWSIPDQQTSSCCSYCLKAVVDLSKQGASSSGRDKSSKPFSIVKYSIGRNPVSKSFGLRLGDATPCPRIIAFTKDYTPLGEVPTKEERAVQNGEKDSATTKFSKKKKARQQLLPGDRIRAINGVAVNNLQQVVQELGSIPVEEGKAELEVTRYSDETAGSQTKPESDSSVTPPVYNRKPYAICFSCFRDPWVQCLYEQESKYWLQVEDSKIPPNSKDDDVASSMSEIMRYLIRWHCSAIVADQFVKEKGLYEKQKEEQKQKQLNESKIHQAHIKSLESLYEKAELVNTLMNETEKLKVPEQIVPHRFWKRADPLKKKGLELMQGFLENNVEPLLAIILSADRNISNKNTANSSLQRLQQAFGHAMNRGKIFTMTGNLCRHSCVPNAILRVNRQVGTVGGGGAQFRLEVLRAVDEGEELLIDYLDVLEECEDFFDPTESSEDACTAGNAVAGNDEKKSSKTEETNDIQVGEEDEDEETTRLLVIAERRELLKYQFGLDCTCRECLEFKKEELRGRLNNTESRHSHLQVGGKHKGHIGAQRRGMRKGKKGAGAHHK